MSASPAVNQNRPTPADLPPEVPDGVDAQYAVPFAAPDDCPLYLDLYRPRNSAAPPPLVVWVHGGAWRGGHRHRVRALPLTQRGYAVASIDYRLSQHARFPAQLEDCKTAVRWLRAHADTYRIDAGHIGVWGSSAGGHLVALLGTTGDRDEFDTPAGGNLDRSSRVQAVCDWFGPSDFLRMNDTPGRIDHDAPDSPESQLIGQPIQSAAHLVARANPITYISGNTPPFLIMHGDQDLTVPLNQSELLHAALVAAGVDSTLRIVPGAGHGFRVSDLIDEVAAFFDQHLKR